MNVLAMGQTRMWLKLNKGKQLNGLRFLIVSPAEGE